MRVQEKLEAYAREMVTYTTAGVVVFLNLVAAMLAATVVLLLVVAVVALVVTAVSTSHVWLALAFAGAALALGILLSL